MTQAVLLFSLNRPVEATDLQESHQNQVNHAIFKHQQKILDLIELVGRFSIRGLSEQIAAGFGKMIPLALDYIQKMKDEYEWIKKVKASVQTILNSFPDEIGKTQGRIEQLKNILSIEKQGVFVAEVQYKTHLKEIEKLVEETENLHKAMADQGEKMDGTFQRINAEIEDRREVVHSKKKIIKQYKSNEKLLQNLEISLQELEDDFETYKNQDRERMPYELIERYDRDFFSELILQTSWHMSIKRDRLDGKTVTERTHQLLEAEKNAALDALNQWESESQLSFQVETID